MNAVQGHWVIERWDASIRWRDVQLLLSGGPFLNVGGTGRGGVLYAAAVFKEFMGRCSMFLCWRVGWLQWYVVRAAGVEVCSLTMPRQQWVADAYQGAVAWPQSWAFSHRLSVSGRFLCSSCRQDHCYYWTHSCPFFGVSVKGRGRGGGRFGGWFRKGVRGGGVFVGRLNG